MSRSQKPEPMVKLGVPVPQRMSMPNGFSMSIGSRSAVCPAIVPDALSWLAGRSVDHHRRLHHDGGALLVVPRLQVRVLPSAEIADAG